MFIGIYFCFISLSTVGFGDLVPNITQSISSRIYGIVYMFFNILGLSIVSSFICSLVNAMDEMSTLWNVICGWRNCRLSKTLRVSEAGEMGEQVVKGRDVVQCHSNKIKVGRFLENIDGGSLSDDTPKSVRSTTTLTLVSDDGHEICFDKQLK